MKGGAEVNLSQKTVPFACGMRTASVLLPRRWGLAYLESRLNLGVSLLVAARLMLTVGLWLGFNLPLPTLHSTPPK